MPMDATTRARVESQNKNLDAAVAAVLALARSAVAEERHGEIHLKIVLRNGQIVRYHEQTDYSHVTD
jgi:hypothetical protein